MNNTETLVIFDFLSEDNIETTKEDIKQAQEQFADLITSKYERLLNNNPYLAFDYGSLLDLTETEQESLTPAMFKVWSWAIDEAYEKCYLAKG